MFVGSQGARLCVHVMKVCANDKKHSREVSLPNKFCLSGLTQFVVAVWRLDGVMKRQGL